MIEIPKVIYQVWIQNKLPEYIKKKHYGEKSKL